MEIVLLPQAEEDLLYWQKKGESRILKRIRVLLADILEHPFSGIGKPEATSLDIFNTHQYEIVRPSLHTVSWRLSSMT